MTDNTVFPGESVHSKPSAGILEFYNFLDISFFVARTGSSFSTIELHCCSSRRNPKPDIGLVLMDIDLGSGIDGIAAAQQILHRRELPIVFLTSHTEKEFVERAKTITNYGYVVKGSGEFVLIESVGMALQLFDAHRRTAKRQLELGERVKELSCLHEVEHLIGDDELTEEQVLRAIAQLLPSTWQYPEITTARISVETRVFSSGRGAEAPQGPFFAEERKLIDTIAGRLGRWKEQRRATERTRLQAQLLDAVDEAVMATGMDGTIIYWNSTAKALYGWSEAQVLGRHVFDVTVPDTSREQAHLGIVLADAARLLSGRIAGSRGCRVAPP